MCPVGASNAAQHPIEQLKIVKKSAPAARITKVIKLYNIKIFKVFDFSKTLKRLFKGGCNMAQVKEMLIIRPEEGMDGLTVRRLKVLQAIQKKLGDSTARVDYYEIAKEVGMSRNGVKYAVDALLKAKLLGVCNGKLFVAKKSVL